MKKVCVLGAGMVGAAMAKDLAGNYEVIVADKSAENLSKFANTKIITIQKDLNSFENIKSIVESADLVIGALPGFMGFRTLDYLIELGKNVVDISFFPEDAYLLDEKAKQHGVTIIVDIGVAPGMSNFILGAHNKSMVVQKFICYVGGLPKVRSFPFQYKAPFSPIDVLEEYTRPARYIENSHLVVKPALSDPEFIEFDNIGTLEAFNTDGLRSIIRNIKAPNMIEKTLRWPGHIDLMKAIIGAGFLESKPKIISGIELSPLEFTSNILFDNWKLKESDPEFTVMRVIVEGSIHEKINGFEKESYLRYIYDLYDETDFATGTSSMARTTGYTATAAANLLLNGMFETKGIIAPEMLPEDEIIFNYVLNYLKERNVIYKVNREIIK